MSSGSKIEWTNATWNPVTGCTKISDGCDHCYASTFAERFRGVPNHPYSQGFDLKLWEDRLGLPLQWTEPRKIFVNSMSDLYHEKVPLDFIKRVFATMRATPQHRFQILTKRAKRLAELSSELLPWPKHVWQGVSVESAAYKWRIELLRKVPARVRFLSIEPLIGDVGALDLGGIHWVIVGGESGIGQVRPMNPNWARSVRDQCKEQGVPFFMKQFGKLANNPNPKDPTAKENGGTAKGGRRLDGRLWGQFPSLVRGSHSGRLPTSSTA